MALRRRLAKQFLGLGHVGLDASAEPVGLGKIELGIGVTLRSWPLPCGDSGGEIPV